MVAIDTKKRDVQYLSDSTQWQRWPMCPVKRTRDGECECGIVLMDAPTVYKVNMFMIGSIDDFDDCEKEEFASMEDLVDAGWQVD
jgi:hypothetical protein